MEILSKKMFIAPNGQHYALYTKNRDFEASDFEITATKSIYTNYLGKPSRIENVYQVKSSEDAKNAYMAMENLKDYSYRINDAVLRPESKREVIPSDGIFTFGSEMRGVRNQDEKAKKIMQESEEVANNSVKYLEKRTTAFLDNANQDLKEFLRRQEEKVINYLKNQSEIIFKEDDELEAYREKIRNAMEEVKLMREILKVMYEQKLAEHPLITENIEFTNKFMNEGLFKYVGEGRGSIFTGNIENFITREKESDNNQ